MKRRILCNHGTFGLISRESQTSRCRLHIAGMLSPTDIPGNFGFHILVFFSSQMREIWSRAE